MPHRYETEKQHTIPLRVANLTDRRLTLYKGSVMAIAEPILSIKHWSDVAELSTVNDHKTKDCLSQSDTTMSSKRLPTLKTQSHSVPKESSIDRSDAARTAHTDCECVCNCKTTPVDMSPLFERRPPVTSPLSSSYCALCCHQLEQMSPKDKYQAFHMAQTSVPSGVCAADVHANLPEHVQELYEQSLGRLDTEELRGRVKRLLYEYSDCFAMDSEDIGQATLIKHDIDTGDAAPVRQRCRRFAKCHIDAIKDHVKKLSESGVIRPSNSEWASNIVVVKKKDGTWRMCIDYRELNAKTRNPDSYLLPRIDDTLDALANAKVFCTLDLTQGYHHVELTDRSKAKTAFHAPYCNPPQWEYNYMPFGLIRAPRTFQRLMDKVI